MHTRLLEEDIIYADQTHHDVFTDGRKGSQLKQTYIWMFRTGVTAEKNIVLYIHKGGRSGKIATEFLKDYHGYLQSDDYAGYNGVEGTRVLCHAYTEKVYEYRKSIKRKWQCRGSERSHKEI